MSPPLRLLALLVLTVLVAAPPAARSQSAPEDQNRLDLDPRPLPLGGVMADPTLWRDYVARFVTKDGRIVDTANHDISHSEGQGYGMLLATAFGDRPAFDRIWSWTRANLMVRSDSLLAWRWDPRMRPAVSDINDATDGDLLVAWALTEAADFWKDESYAVAARRITVEIGRKLLLMRKPDPPLLLAGVAGFGQGDPSAQILNLSYWVFPAFSRLSLVAPEFDWSSVAQSGLDLLDQSRFGATALPSDWIERIGARVTPAPGFSPDFGYNAVRIPLYMAWAGVGERTQYHPFSVWASNTAGLQIVDVSNGQGAGQLTEPGYRAVAALIECVVAHRRFPQDLRAGGLAENYYPATLRILSVIAARMRYRSCLDG